MDDMDIENMELDREEARKKVSRVSFFCLFNLAVSCPSQFIHLYIRYFNTSFSFKIFVMWPHVQKNYRLKHKEWL